jgi:hypothetical protein
METIDIKIVTRGHSIQNLIRWNSFPFVIKSSKKMIQTVFHNASQPSCQMRFSQWKLRRRGFTESERESQSRGGEGRGGKEERIFQPLFKDFEEFFETKDECSTI